MTLVRQAALLEFEKTGDDSIFQLVTCQSLQRACYNLGGTITSMVHSNKGGPGCGESTETGGC